MTIRADRRILFGANLIVWALVGAFLRLHLIADQVLLDDEWHALYYSTAHSLAHLLRHATHDANSSPLNAYAWILLSTSGWSELPLRIPSLLPGLLSLIVLPLLARRVHGDAVASVFAVFLSLSPFLVSYSRIFRPYSALVFFTFISIYSAGIWIESGERRFRLLHLLTAACAFYFHPVSALGVFSPWIAVAVIALLRGFRASDPMRTGIQPSARCIVMTAALDAFAFAIIVQPSVIGDHILGPSSPTITTWRQVFMIFYGTSDGVLAGALLVVSLFGAWTLYREWPFWGLVFAVAAALHLIMIQVCDFVSIEMPIVLARYFAILIPLCHLSAATGLLRLTRCFGGGGIPGRPGRRWPLPALALLLLVSLVLTNPLWHAFAGPNNFTSHSAFIESGQFGGWDRPYRSSYAPELAEAGPPRISRFYRSLSTQVERLIEYPMVLGDHLNLYYFYQHLHGKEVVIGYTGLINVEPPTRDCVYPDFHVDHVINAVGEKRQVHFRNLVDIMDDGAVRRSDADYLILHRNLLAEFFPAGAFRDETSPPRLSECAERLGRRYGSPVFEDETIIVFALKSEVERAPRRDLAS